MKNQKTIAKLTPVELPKWCPVLDRYTALLANALAGNISYNELHYDPHNQDFELIIEHSIRLYSVACTVTGSFAWNPRDPNPGAQMVRLKRAVHEWRRRLDKLATERT